MTLALWGCANTTNNTPGGNQSSTPDADNNSSGQTQVTQTVIDDTLPPGQRNRPKQDGQPANSSQPDPLMATLQNNDIYCFDQKVGYLKDNRVYMQLDSSIVSFIPQSLDPSNPDLPAFDIKQLSCQNADWANENYTYGNFSYLGLEISGKVFGPYAIYKPIVTYSENNQVTYKCDGSLVKTGEKYRDNVPTLNCQTNDTNLLAQYEFSAASGSPQLTTGGEYGVAWKKVFIKRGINLNYFFIGNVSNDFNDYWLAGDAIGKYRKTSSNESLNKLLNRPDVTAKLDAWQEMVKSFQVENAA